jgi:hypothetical protein
VLKPFSPFVVFVELRRTQTVTAVDAVLADIPNSLLGTYFSVPGGCTSPRGRMACSSFLLQLLLTLLKMLFYFRGRGNFFFERTVHDFATS